MMGRPIRGNPNPNMSVNQQGLFPQHHPHPLNFTINNEFKLNNSGWEMGMKHM